MAAQPQIKSKNKPVTLKIGQTITESLVAEVKAAGAKVNVIYQPFKPFPWKR